MARYAIKTILFSSSVDIRSVLQPSLQLGKTLDMTCGILYLLPSLLNDEEKSVETWDGKGHKGLMLSGLFISVPPYILTKKNKLLFCYLIEVLCCIVTLSPVNIKIVKLHLCQKQIKSWVNMYCCQGAMSRSSVPQKDEHSKTSPRWGSEKSHCFLLSKYKCLQRIDQCVQKLSTTTSSSMITVWACSCTKTS